VIPLNLWLGTCTEKLINCYAFNHNIFYIGMVWVHANQAHIALRVVSLVEVAVSTIKLTLFGIMLLSLENAGRKPSPLKKKL